jgi:ribosomal protein S20
MKTTQKEKRILRYKMRDIRSRERLSAIKTFIFELKQKVNEGEAIIPEELKKGLDHHVKVLEQI